MGAWGTASHNGLIVATEPYEPRLDELLTGRVRVLVAGPEGRAIRGFVDFLDGSGNVLSSEPLGEVVLPWTADTWRKLFGCSNKARNRPSELNAGRPVLGGSRIEGDGLGTATIALSHTVGFRYDGSRRGNVLPLSDW